MELPELLEEVSEEFVPVDENFSHHCPVCGQGWETCQCTIHDLLDIIFEHQIETEVA